MAPRTRTRRQAAITARSRLSPAPGLASARPPSIDNDGRKSRDADHDLNEASDSQNHRPWTPEPEPYDAEKYKAWGRKHYGEDWHEQRETMLRERNFYDTGVNKYSDYVYVDRQKALRKLEREREQGKLPIKKGKTWEELLAWARTHYGEAWWAHREALDRDEREERETLDPEERKKKSLKSAKRALLVWQMELDRDEGMLAEGKTWREIMAWPAQPPDVMPSVETGADAVSSPSTSSEHSDRSGYSTYPPTPTDARRQAMDGPQGEDYQREGNWHWLEWKAIGSSLSKAQYEESKVGMVAAIRSSREDEECEQRNREEWEAISALKWKDQGQYYLRKEQRERRMRDLDLRLKGWTQDRIDAMHRDEAAARKRRLEDQMRVPPTPWIPNQPRTQEEMDARFRAWDAVGVSHERQNELARAYGFSGRPGGLDGCTKRGVVSRSRAPPPRQTKDISRRARSGRVTRTASQGQSGIRTNTRSQQPAGASVEAVQPNRRRRTSNPHRLEALGDNTRTATRRHGRQHKTDREKRTSRRLAGLLPEFGILLERGETAPLYETPRQPSDSGRRRRQSNPTMVKGVKPQGISKTTQTGPSRSQRSGKGPKG